MAISISTVKSKSKSYLKGKWPIAITSALTLLFSFLIIQNIAWLLSIALGEAIANFALLLLSLVFIGPLFLGVVRHFYRIQNGLNESPATAFYYFSSSSLYYKAIRLNFMLAIRLLFFAAVYSLPAIILYVVSSAETYEFLKMPIPIWTQHLSHIVVILSNVATFLTLASLVKFYLAPVLVVVDEAIDAEEALHMSSVISKISLTDLVFLIFSMLFWMLISNLFIPLIFTMPYFIMCYVVHSMEAIKGFNQKLKLLNDEFFPSYVAGA